MQRALRVKEDVDRGRAVGRLAHAGVRIETTGDDDAQHRTGFRIVILVDDQLDRAGERGNVRLGHVHQAGGIGETLQMVLQRDRETLPYRGRFENAVATQCAQIERVDDGAFRIDETNQIRVGRHACASE